jgi:uncharacterized damage-inducible protein DinB
MANGRLDIALGALGFSRRVTTQLLEDIPPDKLTLQPVSGANHALWVLGHLGAADAYFLKEAARQETPDLDRWLSLFFMGSKPMPRLTDYPPVPEVRRLFDGARERLTEWAGTLSEAQLSAPLPEAIKDFGASHAHLLGNLAVHEGLHAGQLTIIRRALGLAPKFG